MPDPDSLPTRGAVTLHLGSILSRTLSTWVRNLPSFTVLSAVVFLPLLVWAVRATSIDATGTNLESYDRWAEYAAALLASTLSSALIYGVLEQIRGRRAGLWTCLWTGLRRIAPVVAVTLTVGLYGLLVVMAVSLPLLALTATTSSTVVAGGALLVEVLALAAVMTTYYVSVPVMVIERPGVRESMLRSQALTRGNRLRILGIWLSWACAEVGATIVAQGALPGTVRESRLLALGLTVVLFAPLAAISSALVYHDLRRGIEGATLEELTAVFD